MKIEITEHISQTRKLVNAYLDGKLTSEQMIEYLEQEGFNSYSDGYNQCIEDNFSKEI